jgi:hypothetical protein
VTVVLASVIFGSLLSPPLLVLLVLAWLLGAHALLALPLAVWATATTWMAINAGIRHLRRRERFVDALTDAPLDVVEQMLRLVGVRRRGLRVV